MKTREEREAELIAMLDQYDRDRAEWEAELKRKYSRPDLPPESEESKERGRKYLAIVGEEWDRYVHSLTQEDYDEYFDAHPGEPEIEGIEALFMNAKIDAMEARIEERARAAGLDWASWASRESAAALAS